MADTQKYFLDLTGLTKLWSKIKATFADKEQTESSIEAINTNIGQIGDDIQLINVELENINNNVNAITPQDVDYYEDAIELSYSVVVGTTIKVNKLETNANDPTPSGYSTGIYIVTAPGVIEYISTSDGSVDDSGITELGDRVKELEDTVVKSAALIDENGNMLNETFTVNDNVLLIAHDDSFDINTESVKSLTHRAIAAKFKDLENVISGIPKFKISVVDELPDPDKGDIISLSTIYLLRNTPSGSEAADNNENLFTEYIYVELTKDNPETTDVNESKYGWEKLGEQTLVIDNLVTQNQLSNALSSALSEYSKTADIEKLVSDTASNLRNEIYETVESTYATIESVDELRENIEGVTGNLDNYLTKNEASSIYVTQEYAEETYFTKDAANNSGWVTEADVLASIQTGNIGEAIMITEKQIDDMIAAANN